jgi:ABC-type sugar transport system substrate-binding protein
MPVHPTPEGTIMFSSHSTRRTIAVSVLGAAVVAAIAGCSASAPAATGTADADAPVHLAIELVASGLPFSQEVQAGAELAAKDLDVKLDVTAPATIDPPTAISQVENALNSGVDGIAIADEPATLWTRTLSDAFTATDGQLIAFNTIPVAGTPVATYVGIEAVEYGVQLADETVKAAGLDESTTGEVIVGQCFLGSEPLTLTTNAVFEELGKLLPNATLVPIFESQPVPTDNFAAWEQMIGAHRDTVLAIGTCDQDANSMIKARETSGLDYAIGVVQSSPQVLTALKDGTVAAAVTQNYYAAGYLIVKLLADSVRAGEPPVAGWIDMGTAVTTKENVADLEGRDSGGAGQQAYYQPIIDELLSDLPAVTKPLADIQ